MLIETLFAAGPMSGETWRGLFDPGVHLRIGNRRPALCLEPALKELKRLLARVDSFGGYRDVWEVRDATWIETEMHRDRGASALVIPCAIVFRTGGRPLALDVRFYCDVSPLFPRSAPPRRSGAGRTN
ncbi:hypothetical protein ACFPOB_25205 [Bosea eneae]|uniref:SnoaL-like domain-containing protein n=1 Tax=Bosea eneae TaxID=151454 RepID=A0ABW0J1U2_9HYPH